jgi:hypothetical protein
VNRRHAASCCGCLQVVGSERNSVIVPLVAVSKFQEAITRLLEVSPHSELPDGL